MKKNDAKEKDAVLKEESRKRTGGGDDVSGKSNDNSILQSLSAADKGGTVKGMKFVRKGED